MLLRTDYQIHILHQGDVSPTQSLPPTKELSHEPHHPFLVAADPTPRPGEH